MDREKLIKQLFVGKVTEIIGTEKTMELLKDATVAIDDMLKSRKADIRRFYFKVNNSKLQDESRLKNQIEKVIKRLVERNNIHSKSVELSFGAVDDDFVFDRCRLCISFNCA